VAGWPFMVARPQKHGDPNAIPPEVIGNVVYYKA